MIRTIYRVAQSIVPLFDWGVKDCRLRKPAGDDGSNQTADITYYAGLKWLGVYFSVMANRPSIQAAFVVSLYCSIAKSEITRHDYIPPVDITHNAGKSGLKPNLIRSKINVRIRQDGWIRHNPGVFPFPSKTIVETIHADGLMMLGSNAEYADFWHESWWKGEASSWRRNILFYRIVRMPGEA
jgi:hypothetical protein